MDNKRLLLYELDNVTLNHYEAVLIASKRARAINARRLKQMELMTEDTADLIDYRKVTSIALEDMMSSRVKFRYKGE